MPKPSRCYIPSGTPPGRSGPFGAVRAYVNHYSFHIMDRQWGHLVIKMAGHAPFAAQVLLNGHEYVAVTAQGAGIGFVKDGSCFTGTTDPAGLAQIADTLSQDAAAGRLSQVTNRWTYTACLVFGLDLADRQRTCFTYAYSVYQAEYSRNLLFVSGRQMQDILTPRWTGPVPPGCPPGDHAVRHQDPPADRPGPAAPAGGRDQDTCV